MLGIICLTPPLQFLKATTVDVFSPKSLEMTFAALIPSSF